MSRRLALATFAFALAATGGSPWAQPIQARDRAAFWSIVSQARGPGGERHHSERLRLVLSRLAPERIIDFQVHYENVFAQANRGDVWAAGVLLNGGHGSDDGFEYFRHWLIGQGQAVYEAALADPDSLAAVEVDMSDGTPNAEWEAYGAAAEGVFEAMTGTDIYSAAPTRFPRADPWAPPAFDWRSYTNEVLQQKLPRLWKLYGRFKMEFDRRTSRPA
jgi:hypothetical protein